jgi:hypothetical protein
VTRLDARIELAVDTARRASPELDPRAARRAIEQAAATSRERNLLAGFLGDHADGLNSGASSGPPVIARVVDALRALGATNLAKPRCARCEGEKKLSYVVDGGRICAACSAMVKAKECVRCGRIRPVSCSTPEGPICSRCRAQDAERHNPCVRCGERKLAAKRTDEGPVCHGCYERPESKCDACGQHTKIHSKRSGRALCDRCYRSPARLCGMCGKIGIILRRGDDTGAVDICERCYEQPVVKCVRCGRTRRCSARSDKGPLCQACAPRLVRACSRCGRERPAQAVTKNGPVCSTCYDHVHRTPCGSCGKSCRPYERGRCARCVLRERIETLLSGNASIRPELQPLVEAIGESPRPVSMLRWLSHSDGADVLKRLASGEVDLSHEGLDGLTRTKRLDHLRGLLVATQLLPETVDEFDRLEPWLDELLAEVPPRRAQVVRAFASWRILRRARRKAEQGRLSENGVKWARLRIRQALVFLEWLGDHDIELEALAQRDVDLWLAGGPTTRYVVRDFLTWARERKIVPDVEVPARQVRTPVHAVDDDERWSQVDRLLSDDSIELDVRVAGLFSLLYGQHLSRVSRLRRADLDIESGRATAVCFGADRVVLPPGLDSLTGGLLERRGHALIRGDSTWLFPGGTPGRPITAERFRRRLAEVGVELRPTRQAALLQLAAELPAPVLADLLGLHTNTAVEWVRAARGDWSVYAASGPGKVQVPAS